MLTKISPQPAPKCHHSRCDVKDNTQTWCICHTLAMSKSLLISTARSCDVTLSFKLPAMQLSPSLISRYTSSLKLLPIALTFIALQTLLHLSSFLLLSLSPLYQNLSLSLPLRLFYIEQWLSLSLLLYIFPANWHHYIEGTCTLLLHSIHLTLTVLWAHLSQRLCSSLSNFCCLIHPSRPLLLPMSHLHCTKGPSVPRIPFILLNLTAF